MTDGFRVITEEEHQTGIERNVLPPTEEGNRANDTLRTARQGTPISVTLQMIDKVIMSHLNDHVNPVIDDAGTQIIVPVEYANAERWKQIRKDGVIRDAAGKIQTPLIIFHRTNIKRGALTNPINRFLDRTYQTGWNRHNTYDKFAVLNRIIPSKELRSVSIPDYIDLTYQFVLWTDFMEQMNALIEQINFEMDSYWGSRGEFKFRVKTDSYEIATELPAEGDRVVKATFTLEVSGYLLPETMMTIDKGPQATEQVRYSNKKVITVTEIDGTRYTL